MQVAGQLDPFVQAALAFALLGRVLDAGGQGGEPSERHHRLALAVVEREVVAFAVGEDHPEPAPRGRDRRAGQVGALGQLGVAGGHVLGEVTLAGADGDLDHAVLFQGLLGDRRLVDRAADPLHQLRRHPAGADRDHRPVGLVVQQQHRAPHRRQRHHRLAHAVVEDARFGRLVEFGEQPDQHLDRPGARRRCSSRRSPGAHLHQRDYAAAEVTSVPPVQTGPVLGSAEWLGARPEARGAALKDLLELADALPQGSPPEGAPSLPEKAIATHRALATGEVPMRSVVEALSPTTASRASRSTSTSTFSLRPRIGRSSATPWLRWASRSFRTIEKSAAIRK